MIAAVSVTVSARRERCRQADRHCNMVHCLWNLVAPKNSELSKSNCSQDRTKSSQFSSPTAEPFAGFHPTSANFVTTAEPFTVDCAR